MGNIKTCDRDQISVLKQTLKQLPAQIPIAQIPSQKQNLRLRKLSLEEEKLILVCFRYPDCFGYYTDGVGCEGCCYSQREFIEEQIQYFLSHWQNWKKFKSGLRKHFYTIKGIKPEVIEVESVFSQLTAREIGGLIYDCRAKTSYNKLHQDKSYFQKEGNKLEKVRLDSIVKRLKNL